MFSALSTIVINAYKREMLRSHMHTWRGGDLLAAVSYVEDTDFLHCAGFHLTSDEELIENVQRDVPLWGASV